MMDSEGVCRAESARMPGVPRAREHAIDRGPRPLENLLVQARRRADPC